MTVHSVAEKGFQSPSLYHTSRPSYPPEALQYIFGNTPATTPTTIIDLGAGTGLFTSLIPTSPSTTLHAIEPSQSMLTTLQKHLPNVHTHLGHATAIPLPPHSAHILTVAQAFHWFAHIDALREMHRVLQPHGRLVLIWNMEDDRSHRVAHLAHSVSWVRRLRDLYEKYDDGAPQYRKGAWRDVWTSTTNGVDTLFELPLQERTFEWVDRVTVETVKKRIESKSYIQALDETEREDLMRNMGEVLREAAGVDDESQKADGDVWLDMPYVTEVVITRKLERVVQ